MEIKQPKQKYSNRYVYIKNNFVNPFLLTSALMAGSLIAHYRHGLAFKEIPINMLILVIFLIVVIFFVRRSMRKKIAEVKNESLSITYKAMKPMLITLSLIALILLVTTVFLSVKQPAIYIEQNTYVNNDIGVKLSLPDAWHPYIDDNVKTTHLLAVHKNPYKSFKPVNGMISDNIYPYILFAYLSLDKNEKDLSEKVKEMVRKEFISINSGYKIISDQKTKTCNRGRAKGN
ncbi:MAG: hypothetical protein HY807_08800 [Nitrospirae bacterium]|nr:hypothetical protein [Nitrospirota bacterium]